MLPNDHYMLITKRNDHYMLAYVLPPVESSQRQNNRTITQYTADDILAQLWHVTGKEKKHWIYSVLKTCGYIDCVHEVCLADEC